MESSDIPLRVVRTNASTGASYSDPISVDDGLPEAESELGLEQELEPEPANHHQKECSSSTSVETESVEAEESGTEEVHDVYYNNNDNSNSNNNKISIYYNNNDNSNKINSYDDDDDDDDCVSEADDNNCREQKTSYIKERETETETETEMEAQEWTYEDSVTTLQSSQKRRQSEQDRRNLRYERSERRRISKFMWFGVVLLMLEVAAATIAVMNHQELVECCGRSIFSEAEPVAERWNKIFYWIGIAYLVVLILIEIPTLVIAMEPMFLFNPMVGYLLAMQMMYATDPMNAYIIYGLETVAMLGQSIILIQMRRSPELCIHSILNYTLSGIVVYLLIVLTQQKGYCIVDDRIQSIFSDSTCNIACIDEASCFRCNADGDDTSSTQCFIQFE